LKLNYFIQLAYNGTNYHGWQIQPNAVTVQSVLTHCLSTTLGEDVELIGAGRTDTGVHAKFFIAHFFTINETVLCEDFLFKLNRFLPKDIAVQQIFRVNNLAHSRFSALSRTYQYYISQNKNPFRTNFAHFHYSALNLSVMNDACKILFEYEDFTSFSKSHTDTKTNICKIMSAEWTQNGDMLVFTIKADRFLRNMVRAIVGTMIDIGSGKCSLKEFRKIIESKNRSNAGSSVAPQALYLVDIEYNDDIYNLE